MSMSMTMTLSISMTVYYLLDYTAAILCNTGLTKGIC